jgi:CDP-diacylglycerol---serine O-phosphatidyltransferase
MPQDAAQDAARNDSQTRGQRRRSRKAVYAIPSLLTTANIFCGFYSVMESLAGAQFLSLGQVDAATEHFDRAAVNIGFAVLFDFLDGRIARLTGATSEFGIELDSIADVISFGIAPAVLAFAWGYGQIEGLHKVAWAASFIFVICGALRLARFNVQARQPKPNLPVKNPKVDKKAFVGMPIPAGASLIAAIAHFTPTPLSHRADLRVPFIALTMNETAFAVGLIILVASLAFLMVSTIRYSSFKNLGSKNQGPRILILGIALVVVAIWFYSQWSLLIISTLYASHGLIAKFWSMVKPRRASALDQSAESMNYEG